MLLLLLRVCGDAMGEEEKNSRNHAQHKYFQKLAGDGASPGCYVSDVVCRREVDNVKCFNLRNGGGGEV